MTLFSLKAACGLAAALFLTQASWAQSAPGAPAPRINPGLHMIITPGVSLTMDGNRVLAKTTRRGITTYHYEQGRLVRARHGNGKITHYHYTDGKLDRIVLPDGSTHTPVYINGTLAMLESSSGKKLGLTAGVRAVDKVALMPRPPGAAGMQALKGGAARPSRDALNRTLIAVDNWEAMKTGWDCTIQPEGDSVCIGMPDSQPPSGGDGSWLPVDPGAGDGGISTTPGDDGGGAGAMPGEGSDRIPPHLNTQESCIAAAKNTWEIMRDEFCPMVRDQAVCLRQNWALFLDLRQECIATFPLP